MRAICLTMTLSLTTLLASAGAQEVDYSRVAKAPAKLSLREGVKVGYGLEGVTTSPLSPPLRTFVRVIGETDTTWLIETNNIPKSVGLMAGGGGLCLALEVDKTTHEVKAARIGRPGERLRAVKIAKPAREGSAAKPARQERFPLPNGKTVLADVFVSSREGKTRTTWIGAKDTVLEGVKLQIKAPEGELAYSLTGSDPEARIELEDKDPRGQPLTVTGERFSYSNKSTLVISQDPVAQALARGFVQASLVASGFKADYQVVRLTTKARAKLTWN